MKPVCLHNKETIAAVLKRSPLIHLYAIGDLDDFFWPYTTWYGSQKDGDIAEIALIYSGLSIPVLFGITERPAAMRELLHTLMPLLPREIYAHLHPEVLPIFRKDYAIAPHGLFYQMALKDRERLSAVDTSAVVPLTVENAAELQAFYRASYPGNWFDPRMLETGFCYGIREGETLTSVAGIHVYSAAYRVAALGNITTRPEYRGRGLATRVTAGLCHAMSGSVDHIGLNVNIENKAAIACYEKLGFQRIGTYGEYTLAVK